MAEPPILDVAGLSVSYRTQRGALRALQDVSFTVPRGEVLGIVGESGSGKSTAILALLGLLGPGADVHAERAAFDGADLLSNAASLRGRRIGMVFQDPSSALNPALTIGLQVAEPMLVHRRLPQAEAFARATELLVEMGIPRPAQIMRAYPHQLSGGMKQRVVIASALAGDAVENVCIAGVHHQAAGSACWQYFPAPGNGRAGAEVFGEHARHRCAFGEFNQQHIGAALVAYAGLARCHPDAGDRGEGRKRQRQR